MVHKLSSVKYDIFDKNNSPTTEDMKSLSTKMNSAGNPSDKISATPNERWKKTFIFSESV